LPLGYQQDLHSLIEELTAMRGAEVQVVLDSAIERVNERQSALQALGLSGMDLTPTVRYGATLRVLRDLIRQGWTIREDDEGIILDAPGRAAVRLGDPEAAKVSIRQSFAFAREAQLREPPTLEFIATTERRGVDRLFTSGAELATRLTTQGTAAVQPELQVIEPGARDETTGLFLQDVWRYARHFLVDPVSEHSRTQHLLLSPGRSAAGAPVDRHCRAREPGPRARQARRLLWLVREWAGAAAA
jgi:hypothetical protein